MTFDPSTSITGHILPGSRASVRLPQTSNIAVNAKFRAVGASSLRPLVSATAPGGTGLAHTYVLQTAARDSAAVARVLQGTPGVDFAEPDRYVNTLNTGTQPLGSVALAIPKPAKGPRSANTALLTGGSVPSNDALTYSAQAFLNAGGVDAVGAFSLLQSRFGEQPGTGETITNVSIGDLTDQAMADAGDAYVRSAGPTTVLHDGQRYLDLPSMPLIPTYVAGDDGSLDGAGSTEHQDPALDEVMLDFSVMAPLAHDRQRPQATGSGYTDLLGIAPGANYRLVVPQQPTMDRIATALLAAAHQVPRPDVITASLGFGTDAQGLPGRYLEDDPVIRSAVASIVRLGVVVSISSNDGTRLFTPAAVGPDGGSTPTDTTANASQATSISDDAASTTPSRIPDSGAIAAGGTTLDDTLASPAQGTGPAVTAETRISGFGTFSSGFGSRVDLSAPSDNIVAFSHASGGTAQDVSVSLNGGTSASAPEIAAAAAVVLQAGRLGGRQLTPAQVRRILERTGRPVATPAQVDQPLHVGPQIDVTAAAEEALGHLAGSASIVRLSVAHRVARGGLGGTFLETTDQGRIDLGDMAAGGNGEGLVGPVTFAGDVTGLNPDSAATYALTVGSTVFRSLTPAIRVTPRQLLDAAGLRMLATGDRQFTVTYRVLSGSRPLAAVQRTLTVGSSDGQYVEALAPQAPAVSAAGQAVTVSYDLTGVARVLDPQLVVSTVGHWNPVLAPLFSAAWHQPLTALKGTVTIPAQAFGSGGGIYGIGIAQAHFGGNPALTTYGEFAPIRIAGGTPADRPQAPTLTAGDGVEGHSAEVTRSAPAFTVHYDVRAIPGARAGELEISAPGPTVFGALNTFTNANGTRLDDDSVDTPSTLHLAMPTAVGAAHLNALALGLASSDTYGVRILALDRNGHVLGQASPLSSLSFDDGPAPDGSTVLSFGIGGDSSLAALRTPAAGTEVRHYTTASGAYGPVLTQDRTPGSDYEVLGVADHAHRALLVHQVQPGTDVDVEVWDTLTNQLVGSTTLPAAQYRFVVGRVDPARATGAVLLRGNDNSDLVLPVDLRTGTTTALIPADTTQVTAGSYSLLDIDTSTGEVYLGKGASIGLCLGAVTMARVNLQTRDTTPVGQTSGCSHGIASDGAGTLYNLSATAASTKITPTSVLQTLDTATGLSGAAITVRQEVPVSLALDAGHQIALVSYTGPAGTVYYGSQQGLILDNNATGQIAVVDLTLGDVSRTLTGFAVQGHGGPLMHGGLMNSLQLDPATRTGWTFGPGDAQIQQFNY